ncbi:Urease accessory protein UreE [Corynebacterium appendicis CIP 107643]|uniref:urease accessory protein UreE n=1 Tax=Corynebacterium appendicis TaxID=163202 RepID=UPI0025B37E29|nr:urease accessory protein UreE [Corynebacterium appendicis]WJY60583.1 Urease accessory protein UreE [Corynebacterium appendicis CIP 107643]
MLITKILGNVNDTPDGARATDSVVFDNESRVKRVQRVVTEAGSDLGLRLDSEFKELKDGDILYRDGDAVIVAKIAPVDVLVIKPRTIKEALLVGHTLGNRHLQAQFFDASSVFGAECMVVRYDHTVEHTLEHLEVDFDRGEHVMPRPFRHAEHTH